MRVILDGDIILYEVPFASETGWKAITGREEQPPWEYVSSMYHQRLDYIMNKCAANEVTIFVSKGRSFRYDIATVKPYKGNRKDNKPWHRDNLLAYMKSAFDVREIEYLEADDGMAIEHLSSLDDTIICSRDKDMMTIPGNYYRWELGSTASYGPEKLTKEGFLTLSSNHKKLSGSGLSFTYAQILIGDSADNIPGCPGIGPVAAYELLNDKSPDEQLANVINEYQKAYGETWEEMMTEQGILCWIVRRLDLNQKPVIYNIGMTS